VTSYDKPDESTTRGPFPNAEAPMRFGKFNPKSKRSLAKLAGEVPKLSIALAKAEADQAKTELKAKAIKGGTGAGLFAVVAFFAVTLWAGLNTVFAPWLSALIVAGALLVIMIIASLVAIMLFKRMGGVMPSKTINSVKQDLNALKGMGKYE
jgi:hypothetical protein